MKCGTGIKLDPIPVLSSGSSGMISVNRCGLDNTNFRQIPNPNKLIGSVTRDCHVSRSVDGIRHEWTSAQSFQTNAPANNTGRSQFCFHTNYCIYYICLVCLYIFLDFGVQIVSISFSQKFLEKNSKFENSHFLRNLRLFLITYFSSMVILNVKMFIYLRF